MYIYTQIYTYPFSPKLPSHPGCHITLSRVPCVHSMSLLVIHFKYSSVCMSIPNSLTTSSPYPKGILSYCLNISLKRVSQPPDLIQTPTPTPSFTNTTVLISVSFQLKNRSLHPQAGARLTPLHSGVAEVSLGGYELSAQSPTGEGDPKLNGSWSRAWSTGSVREAEVNPCRAGAEISPRTEAGSPEHRRQS